MSAHTRSAIAQIATPSMVLVPADLGAIAVVRAALTSALADRSWEPDDMHRVVLATSEATANAVEHGSLPGELVEVVYLVGDSEASVRVLDSGATTKWTPPAAPTLPADDAVRGRGLALIAHLAQRVEVRSAGRGTEIRLDFRRAA